MYIYIPKIKVRYQSITELLTIKEYRNLIDREPFLSITWEPDFFHSCSFCRMLEELSFYTNSRQNNDLIFLKCPENLVFGPFWLFLTSFFSKKSCSVTCNWIWTPNTILSSRKNKWANSEKTYEQTIGRTDRCKDRPSFIGPFWPCLTRETTKEDQT